MGSLPCWVWLQGSQSRRLASVVGYCHRWWQESCTKQIAKHCYLNLPAEERILKIKVPHAAVSEILSKCSCGHGGVATNVKSMFAGKFEDNFLYSFYYFMGTASDRWWHSGSDSMGPSSMFGLGQIWSTWKAHRDLNEEYDNEVQKELFSCRFPTRFWVWSFFGMNSEDVMPFSLLC